MNKFDIPPDDCLIALEFRKAASLREIAARMGQDPSALLRKVQRIAQEHQLLEKIKGRWVLTSKGHLLNRWTEDSLLSQKRVLESRPQLRIGTTTWLAEQVVVPFYACLQRETEQNYIWVVQTPNRNFEAEIIEGTSDYIIACKAPVDPLVAYKRIAREEWILIAPKVWQKELRKYSSSEMPLYLSQKNFVRHLSINADEFLGTNELTQNISISVDGLVSVRSAVANGYGWSLVPKLAVLKELQTGEVLELDFPRLKELSHNHLCLWWSRTRSEPRKLVSQVQAWLEKTSLGG